MKNPSYHSHNFSEVPRAEIQRSSFDRSHGAKTTFDAGDLVPIYVDEALPGDTFNLRMTAFGRLATPIHPILDNLYFNTFFFFVPNRLIWDNWEKFNGAQDDPGDSTSFVIPQMVETIAPVEASLTDYFGLPTLIAGYTHSSLWHRAYNLIWNEWFRDENLQDSVVVDKDDGPDLQTDYVVLKRGKRHDYFTSCLPWPQKGTAVELPLGTSAPLLGTLALRGDSAADDPADYWDTVNSRYEHLSVDVNPYLEASGVAGTVGNRMYVDGAEGTMTADLSSATAATINQIRQAFQIQKLYERDARGGTRYTEVVKSHFGVTSPDARLQRAEYLGGGQSMININPVEQTSSTDGTSPQGNLAGYGTLSASGHGFNKSFTEHGVLIGLACVRADLSYQQGMNRMFSRSTRWDFYWPSLAHIGEQAVLSKEIFADNTGGDEDVFGYQERFAEYRYKPSQITGQFRSNHATPLDIWHLAQDFAARPVLNAAFIEEQPPMDRILAVPAEPDFLLDTYFQLRCARPMPMYGVPGLVDHF